MRRSHAPHIQISQPVLDYASQLDEASLAEHYVKHLGSPLVYLFRELNQSLVLLHDVPYRLKELAEVNCRTTWTQGKRTYTVVYDKQWSCRDIFNLLTSHFIVTGKMCLDLEDSKQGKVFVFCHVQEYLRRHPDYQRSHSQRSRRARTL